MFPYSAMVQWPYQNPMPCFYPSNPFNELYFSPDSYPLENNGQLMPGYIPPTSNPPQNQGQVPPLEGNNEFNGIEQGQVFLQQSVRRSGKIKKRRKKNKEDEFNPLKATNKAKSKYPQNSNRNVVPNIIHHVISFIQNKNKSQSIVEQLIERLELTHYCSAHRFYLYQKLIKEKLNSYLNMDSLKVFKNIQELSCQVYSESEQRSYNRISCMLASYFLEHKFDPIILTSTKVNSEKRYEHLRVKRIALDRISQLLQ